MEFFNRGDEMRDLALKDEAFIDAAKRWPIPCCDNHDRRMLAVCVKRCDRDGMCIEFWRACDEFGVDMKDL